MHGYFDGWKNDLRMVRNRGSFARNAATTFSGVVITTLAQVLLTPWITRIYGPEAYAVYGLFMAITINVSMLATGSYQIAFILPERHADFLDLLRGTLAMLLIATLICFLLLPFHGLLSTLVPGWSILGPWTMLLPLSIFLTGLSNIVSHSAFRNKAFSVTSGFNAGFNVSVRVFNVGFGLLSSGALYGLVVGEVVVRTLLLGVFVRPLRAWGISQALTKFDRQGAWSMLRHYWRYPILVLPTRWLGLLSAQLPVFMLAAMEETAALGQYAMAGALLLIPLRLFGYSLTSVFMQKATETLRSDNGRLAEITAKLYGRLLMLGVLPFAVLIIFGDLIFGFLLGKEWVASGVFSAMLGFSFFFRLLAEPMNSLFAVLGREKGMFWFHLACVVAGAAALYVGMIGYGDIHLGILLFGISSGVLYAYLAARTLALAGAAWLPRILRAMIFLALSCILLLMMRMLVLGSFWMVP